MKNNIKEKTIMNIGILMLMFVFLDIAITTLFQFINIPMSIMNVIIAAIIDILIVYFLQRKSINIKNYIVTIIIAFTLILISTILVAKTYDTTADGNFYHKTAVGLIKEGWNPVYETSQEFIDRTNSDVKDAGELMWIDHYPKTTWNFGASIYAITGIIESGKVLTIIAMLSTSFIIYAYFSEKLLKKWQAVLIALITVINPVSISQLFSFYVDGAMGLFIYGMLIFLIMISDEESKLLSSKEKWLCLLAEITICMNMKFTGVYFSGIFAFLFYVYWIIKNRKMNNYKKYILTVTSKMAIIVVVGICIIGESTYVRNTISNHNPLYPLLGEGKVDIVTTMQPESFEHMGRAEKLFKSLFSKSENITYASGNEPEIKLPLTISAKEIEQLAVPDTRISGFGVLFSGILIITIGMIIYSLMIMYKKDKKIFNYILIILCAILISTVGLAESWWARYSPHIYLIVILGLFSLFYISNNTEKGQTKYIMNMIAAGTFALIMMNATFFAHWRIEDLIVSERISNEISYLKDNNIKDIAFTDIQPYGILFNLKDNGIDYNIVERNTETMHKYLYNQLLNY